MVKQNSIWITGASSGIGRSLAVKFINNNKRVIGTARRKPELNDIFRKLNDSDLFNYYINDISDSTKVADFYKLIKEEYFIYCLINNAGITSFKPFIENNFTEIDEIIKTNLNGAIYAIKCVIPEMIGNKKGIIINILSVAAKKVFTNSSIYAASKAGLEAFSKVLREEVREHNIKIVNIYPGATATQIWPESTIKEHSEKMMTSEDLADFIFDIYNNAYTLSPEEIVVRPVSGDI